MSKLGQYQLERQQLIAEMAELDAQIKHIQQVKRRRARRLKDVGNAIYDLKHEGDTPHITDHAIVRYLERVEGRDIRELKLAVAKHQDSVKVGNVVVTVNDMTFYEDELEEEK